jgi:hypothetical protein
LELLPWLLAPLPILQKVQVLPQQLPELLTSSKKRHELTGYAALPNSWHVQLPQPLLLFL